MTSYFMTPENSVCHILFDSTDRIINIDTNASSLPVFFLFQYRMTSVKSEYTIEVFLIFS
jgi:hypothetical protein